MRHRLIPLIAVPLALALGACGSGGNSGNSGMTTGGSGGSAGGAKISGSSTSGGGAGLQVTEQEFAIMPADATVKAGKVMITVKDTGQYPHALKLEGAGPGGKDIEIGPVQPGQTKTMTVTLKPGKVEWYCPIDHHKQKGMKGELTVN